MEEQQVSNADSEADARLTIDGPVATVELRAERRRNALSHELASRVVELTDRVRDNREIRCVVLRATGSSFGSGADLKGIRRASPAENLEYNGTLRKAIESFERLRVPVIAAINGNALGGGLELALACPIRIAGDDAKLGLPEVRLGLLPGAGGTQRLPRLIGPGRALRMLLTGEVIDAATALEIGLIDELVPADELHDRARALAERIAANAPLAVSEILAAVREGADLPLLAAIDQTERRLPTLLESADLAEGIDGFLDKRTPAFQGR